MSAYDHPCRSVYDLTRRCSGEPQDLIASMILSSETWMDPRRFKPLREAGASYEEIAAELGVDWCTVRK